jgi:hypothetical protein
MILDSISLMRTVDNINEKYLYGELIPKEEGLETARWIASRQGGKGSYRGMFAPTASDFEQGMRLFTGERLVSASARHIMGQEAARATWLLGSSDPAVLQTYNLATGWMNEAPDFQESGTFCCARCSLAFWRHAWIGNFENKEARISKGLQVMKDNRSSDGKWRAFPFFFAIYTLLGLDLDQACLELKYARPVLEKYVKKPKADFYSKRRAVIFEKALQKVS